VLTRDAVQLMTLEGAGIEKEIYHVEWDLVTAEKAGFDHFMLKEIYEQPKAYLDTMSGRLNESYSRIVLDELTMGEEKIRSIRNIHIVACGTAFHAGMVGKQLLERLAGIPVEADVASE